MDLSIILINWNSAKYVGECLKSVYAQTHEPRFEVIVVDNASYDGCHALMQREFPLASFLQSTRNLGFAKANNLGASMARGKVLLFLNPDTVIRGDAITELYAALIAESRRGITGARLLNSDHTLQTSCILPFPTIFNQMLDADVLKRRWPDAGIFGTRALLADSPDPAEVQAVSGACLMIKRDIFERAGRFSADYFMYSEDVDLCYKVHRLGYRVMHVGKARVIHHGGKSSDQSDRRHASDILLRESVFIFLKKHRGRAYAFLYRCALSLAATLRLALLALVAPFRRRVPLIKWFKIFRWSVGLEPWAARLFEKA